ncbi:AraC family transcriptional regulator [Mucilaginibacter sabulilitoris]|uniref:AraC family transcriptional regulator n=1 Tax=Mucilaginibacter sabulilitoris TaxID=1173583 RepID=A0ABZ0TNT4_9SPHI|nr:AraC family transcriptional regulator [Mucilaginibacter sabulilitoris]WPU92845.1 AraC family transcriptional regulator [Mucilaginibacter sabulilitoris]
MHVKINASKTRTIIDFRQSGFSELVVLGKYNYNKAEDILENHVHDRMIEICYSDKGSQWFAVEKQRYLVKGGDVFIHYPDELHGSGGYPEEKGCLYWFIIKVPKKTKAQSTTAFLINQLIDMNRRHFRGDGSIKKMLEEIFKVSRSEEESMQMLKIKINLLSQLFLLKLIELANKKTNDTDNERLSKIYELINNSITQNLTIERLANEVNLSESRFKNWFRDLSGFTPLDFVQRKRVEHAMDRIKQNPDINFKDLALELNFSSQQYFTTVLKKFTGKTPSEIKQSTLELNTPGEP